MALFVKILRAAVHKNEHAAAVEAAVAEAAEAYALNGGAKNLIVSIMTACQTTSTGKVRTPSVGTLPHIILAAMQAVLDHGEAAGARPVPKAPSISARKVLAAEFAAEVRVAFVDAVAEADADRKAARAARKADDALTAQAIESGAAAVAEAGDRAELAAPVAAVPADVSVMLNLLARCSNEQLERWATQNADQAQRVAGVFSAVAAAAAAIDAAAAVSAVSAEEKSALLAA